jgi:hypothetical protein
MSQALLFLLALSHGAFTQPHREASGELAAIVAVLSFRADAQSGATAVAACSLRPFVRDEVELAVATSGHVVRLVGALGEPCPPAEVNHSGAVLHVDSIHADVPSAAYPAWKSLRITRVWTRVVDGQRNSVEAYDVKPGNQAVGVPWEVIAYRLANERSDSARGPGQSNPAIGSAQLRAIGAVLSFRPDTRSGATAVAACRLTPFATDRREIAALAQAHTLRLIETPAESCTWGWSRPGDSVLAIDSLRSDLPNAGRSRSIRLGPRMRVRTYLIKRWRCSDYTASEEYDVEATGARPDSPWRVVAYRIVDSDLGHKGVDCIAPPPP